MPERPREISRCGRKISCVSERSLENRLTHALLGRGVERPPLIYFEDSENTNKKNNNIFSTTFVKISAQGHVRSGHQVRSSDPTTK